MTPRALIPFTRACHHAADICRDIDTALQQPRAMTAFRRHKDEAKIMLGAGCVGDGIATFNPVALAGGLVAMWEGSHDLADYGHRFRQQQQHGARKAQHH